MLNMAWSHLLQLLFVTHEVLEVRKGSWCLSHFKYSLSLYDSMCSVYLQRMCFQIEDFFFLICKRFVSLCVFSWASACSSLLAIMATYNKQLMIND